MDFKEQIIKFLNEETQQYRCTESGHCRAIENDTKEDTEYLADELIKLFSLHSVSHQRELLIDFYSKQNGGMNETNKDAIIREVDNYIESINCG